MAMAVTRTNIVEDSSARSRFIEGVKRLKREVLDPQQGVSTYDAFVVWHHQTMHIQTPPGQDERNAAHGGPVFLPWHRYMLIAFERQIQRVLDDPTFGLPYWAWNQDGDRPPAQQRTAPIFAADCMGGNGSPTQGRVVTTGPFAFRAGDPQSWRVRIAGTSGADWTLEDRGLRRRLGVDVPTLPTSAEARAAVALAVYDSPDWAFGPTDSFRNICEGWKGPGLHNQVHRFIGMDMGASTSPNDPIFYLNHCNVDRMWAAWQRRNPTASYRPSAGASADLEGHRMNDRLRSVFRNPPRISGMLDVSPVYSYDRFDDLL